MFDFDGTLADTFPFFMSVFNQLAAEYDFRQFGEGDVEALRHKEAREIMKLAGLPLWKLPRVARSFMKMLHENSANIPMFEGVPAMLRQLSDKGVAIAIVSSNSRENVNRILGPEVTRLIRYFECGMSMFGKHSRLRKVLSKTGIDSANAIYIGDQISDFLAARKESIAFGAVSWGYAAPEALRALNPEEEFTDVREIVRIA